MNKGKILAMLAVLLPTLALAGLIVQKESLRSQPPVVRLPITGYDPRDLLYGHYLQFRFDFAGEPVAPACQPVLQGGMAEQCRLCVTASGAYSVIPVEDKTADCAYRLPLTHLTGVRKYFIPEDAAPELDRLLRQPGLVMAVDIFASGDAVTYGGLYITGEPWRDYLRNHPPPDQQQ